MPEPLNAECRRERESEARRQLEGLVPIWRDQSISAEARQTVRGDSDGGGSQSHRSHRARNSRAKRPRYSHPRLDDQSDRPSSVLSRADGPSPVTGASRGLHARKPRPDDEASVDAFDRDAGVDRTRRQPRMLGHETQRADLAVIPDLDVDVNDAAEPDRDAAAQTHASRLDHAASTVWPEICASAPTTTSSPRSSRLWSLMNVAFT